MFNSRFLVLLAALLLAACSRPDPVSPALWLVEGPGGQKAWLFGTIHALPEPVEWRSAKIDEALKQSDRLILEVAEIGDDAATAEIFSTMAHSEDLPALDSRVGRDEVDDLQRELRRDGLRQGELDSYETWAAAVVLAQAQSKHDGENSANGIDRALAASYLGPVGELEGAATQLGIFDALPEAQQRSMLSAVITGGDDRRNEARRLEAAWARGDLVTIARATNAEVFNDDLLRDAVLVGRNRAWLAKLEAMLQKGARPFVAVGAGHLAGDDGLPAMLSAKGFKVTRLQ